MRVRRETANARSGSSRAVLARAEAVLDGGGVVLVDGRSGSGKTSLAARLLERSGPDGRPRQALRVEDLYPGWDGLAEGSAAVARALDEGVYRRYDWQAGAFADTVSIAADRALVIEGCGALTAENVRAARAWAGRGGGTGSHHSRSIPGSGPGRVLALWLDCPDGLRRARALARDGDMFAPHWERWAAQERALFGQHEPWLLADERLPCGG